jgi:formylglycine-generating enzyme required for sulfatase activity
MFVVSLINASPAISVSGIVTDSNHAAIAEARIGLKKYPGKIEFTKSDGTFLFSTSSVLPNIGWGHGFTAELVVRKNRIEFKTEGIEKKITVEVFSSNGVRIFARKLQDVSAGNHVVVLPRTAEVVLFVKLTADNGYSLLRSVNGLIAGSTSVEQVATQSRAGFGALGKKTSSGDIDSLVVFARGYKQSMTGISGYGQTGIKISLSASNPWKPSGTLEHEKGMVKIMAKGFNFEMGQPDSNVSRDTSNTTFSSSEQPVHTVQFTHDFWLDTTEVAQKDFNTLMSAIYGANYHTPKWEVRFGLGDNYPAYLLERGDAVLYCNARSKNDNLDTVYSYTGIAKGTIIGQQCVLIGTQTDFSKNGYRLPTEAEWEYACRGGVFTDFFWNKNYFPYPATSDDSAEIGQYAVWEKNALIMGENNPGYGAHSVGGKKPNAYGLYDMVGNLWEHCNDYWTDYAWETQTDPHGNSSGDYFAIRGGCWGAPPVYLRSANRVFFTPNYRQLYQGFRACREIH